MKASIIILTHNRSELLKQALNSALNQKNIIDYEVIVIDDNSANETKHILKDFSYKHSNLKVIEYTAGSNGHLGILRNIGLREAKGDYIFFLDDDNFYNSDFLFEMIKFLDNHEEINAVYCDSNFLIEQVDGTFKNCGCLRSINYDSKTITQNNYIDMGEIGFKKNVFNKIQFDESLASAGEDWEFILQMKKNKFELMHYKKNLTNYRVQNKRHSNGEKHYEVINEIRRRIELKYYD